MTERARAAAERQESAAAAAASREAQDDSSRGGQRVSGTAGQRDRPPDPSPAFMELARALRQRAELGVDELFLARSSRAEVLALVERMAGRAGSRAPGRPAESTGGGGRSGVPAAEPAGASGQAAPGAWPAAEPRRAGRPVTLRDLPPPLEPDLSGWEHADAYRQVRDAARACVRCRLQNGRQHVVFSDGNPQARVMIVGEAPGGEEDRTGLPFVGPAGRLLDLLLATVALSRESVYICNVIKCRPPGNRNPLPDEIESCFPYLRRQIELVAPEVILAVGSIAAQTLLGRQEALKRLRGVVHRFEGVPVVVTYHPAALLRNPRWTRAAWEDLQLLRRTLERAPAPHLFEPAR